MSDIVPLIDWYPTLYGRWLREGRRYNVGTANRIGYTIHHTAGGVGESAMSYARFIGSWHFSKWFRPGGYNFFIGSAGEILEMCGWDHVGAHAPTCNRARIGVAFQGVFDHTMPNSRQLAAFASLVGNGPVPDDQVGHRDCSRTGCPGNRLHAALPLRTDVKDDDMTPEESQRLKRVEELLELHFGDDARDRRPSAWRDIDVTKQSQGRTEALLAELPGRVAAKLPGSLPVGTAGTVDVDALADRVADVIFSRAGRA